LEVGYAKGKGKKVFVAINKNVGEKEFFYMKGLANKVIVYKDVDDIVAGLQLTN